MFTKKIDDSFLHPLHLSQLYVERKSEQSQHEGLPAIVIRAMIITNRGLDLIRCVIAENVTTKRSNSSCIENLGNKILDRVISSKTRYHQPMPHTFSVRNSNSMRL